MGFIRLNTVFSLFYSWLLCVLIGLRFLGFKIKFYILGIFLVLSLIGLFIILIYVNVYLIFVVVFKGILGIRCRVKFLVVFFDSYVFYIVCFIVTFRTSDGDVMIVFVICLYFYNCFMIICKVLFRIGVYFIFTF